MLTQSIWNGGSILFRSWSVHDSNQNFHLARLSGSRVDAMEELDSEDKRVLSRIKCWFLSHSQHLNFFTILVLASVSMDLMLHFQYGLLLFAKMFIVSFAKKISWCIARILIILVAFCIWQLPEVVSPESWLHHENVYSSQQ